MVKVILSGWEPGLEKVSLNKMLRQQAGFSLREAKDAIDNLLEGEVVVVPVSSKEAAERLVDKATHLGAICHVIEQAESKSGTHLSD